jgi:hypothetical protein
VAGDPLGALTARWEVLRLTFSTGLGIPQRSKPARVSGPLRAGNQPWEVDRGAYTLTHAAGIARIATVVVPAVKTAGPGRRT